MWDSSDLSGSGLRLSISFGGSGEQEAILCEWSLGWDFFSCFYVWVVVKGETVPVYGCLLDAEGQLGMHRVPDILSVPARFHCKCCYMMCAGIFQHHASSIRPIRSRL